MATTPLLDFEHKKGFEIPTKHKEAIRQSHWFGKVPICQLETRYKLGNSTIRRILSYDVPKRARPSRVGPVQKLTDAKIDEVIEYCSENWEQRTMNYNALIGELQLDCASITLQKRLHQKGYHRCVACQKPYLTAAQVIRRLLWAIAHTFWQKE